MIIAVDFDGTIVEHRYPAIGQEIPFAIDTLRKLAEEQHRIILWTVRNGKLLEEAVEFCRERGLEFYAVNRNYPEENEKSSPRYSRKIQADLWIDDRNLGGLPEWGTIYEMIHNESAYRSLPPKAESNFQRYTNVITRFFKPLSLLILSLWAILLSSGCSSYKHVPYLQDTQVIQAIEEIPPMYDAQIMPKDLLTITVNTSDPEAAAPFNLVVQTPIQPTHSSTLTQQPSLQQYLVNNEGNIDFPVLGRIHVGGLTRTKTKT